MLFSSKLTLCDLDLCAETAIDGISQLMPEPEHLGIFAGCLSIAC